MINDFHVHMGKSSRGSNYTVDDLLRSMDRFDIERSGLSILNGVLTPELNDRVMQAVKDHPDRIVGFGYINPREPKAIDEVRRCLDTPGMRGIKFHSWKHGYFPDNNSALPYGHGAAVPAAAVGGNRKASPESDVCLRAHRLP